MALGDLDSTNFCLQAQELRYWVVAEGMLVYMCEQGSQQEHLEPNYADSNQVLPSRVYMIFCPVFC